MAVHDAYRRRREAIYGALRRASVNDAVRDLAGGLLRILVLAMVVGMSLWFAAPP